jgi:pilus assembly protein CpaF
MSRAAGGLAAALRDEGALSAGPLGPFLREPDVTDVVVNGPGPVWVDRGRGLEQTDTSVGDDLALRRLAQRLVAACGRRLDDAVPYADARLPDGTRVHAVLPPLSPQGTCLSLRVPPRRTFTLEDLVRRGAVPDEGAELLEAMVRSRLAFVVTGGTGSGKTTVLSTLLSCVAPDERMVVIEDAAELRPQHPHVVRLEVRHANAEGAGEVDMSVLVRQALRMRPDRIVVGEVRGGEVRELLAALNTGHEGGCGTLHANRPEQVPARIEALCSAAGLGRHAAHSQLGAALDAVIHLRRGRDGSRAVASVGVLSAGPDGLVRVVPAHLFTPVGVTDGPGAEQLAARAGGR